MKLLEQQQAEQEKKMALLDSDMERSKSPDPSSPKDG